MSRPSNRERILDAFEDLVIRRGVAGTSLDAVAEAAGVSKGGLLYHFPARTALLDGFVERLLRGIADITAAAPTDPAEIVRWYLDPAPIEAGARGVWRSLIAALHAADEGLEQAIADAFDRYTEPLRALPTPISEHVRLLGDGLFLNVLLGTPIPSSEDLSRIVDELVDRIESSPRRPDPDPTVASGTKADREHGYERTLVNDHDHDHKHDHRHFDEMAATWDDEAKIARARMIADRITEAVSPTTATRVFEYGAGTGLVTEAFGDHIGPALLADSSEGMRNVMASKVANGLLLDAQISDVDLSSPDVELPEERFDLVITVLTLHHIPEIERVLGRFHELLLDDGQLCVVDLDAEDGSFHGDGFVGHHGFDREELTTTLRSAGFDPVEISDCGSLTRDDGDYPMFLAVATKAASGGTP